MRLPGDALSVVPCFSDNLSGRPGARAAPAPMPLALIWAWRCRTSTPPSYQATSLPPPEPLCARASRATASQKTNRPIRWRTHWHSDIWQPIPQFLRPEEKERLYFMQINVVRNLHLFMNKLILLKPSISIQKIAWRNYWDFSTDELEKIIY